MNKEDPSQCIFCKILAGEADVSMIYEDELIAIFPPLDPVNPGHILIIPKIHAPYIKDVPEKTLAHIMVFAKKMAEAIRKSEFTSEGVNLMLADGEAAMQEVFHFHLHVFPRYEGDGFGLKYGDKNFIMMTRDEIDTVAEEIKKQL